MRAFTQKTPNGSRFALPDKKRQRYRRQKQQTANADAYGWLFDVLLMRCRIRATISILAALASQ